MCITGKVEHNIDGARRAAGRATWKNRQSGSRETVTPYLCEKCGAWHAGRGPKGNDKPGLEPVK